MGDKPSEKKVENPLSGLVHSITQRSYRELVEMVN
jgi:hypothetical protein